MRKITISALLCLSLAACGQTSSMTASPMKPGLWQVTVKSDAMKNAPKISPEQAAQMRKMGIEVPDMGAGGMKSKVCYTQAALAQNAVPSQQSSECKTQSLKRSGDSFSAETVCDGPNMKGKGTVNGTMTSTSFQFNSTFNGTMGGRASNQSSQISGTFISDNCGNVKPLGTK